MQFSEDLKYMFAGSMVQVARWLVRQQQFRPTYQRPGDLERMQRTACSRMLATHLVEGAGHWVQQEQPAEVARLLLEFLGSAAVRGA